MKNFLYLGVLFLMFTACPHPSFAQTSEVFYQDEFIFDDEVFKIVASRENNLEFKVSLLGEVQTFDLVNLQDGYIFHKKLSRALKTVMTANKKDYREKNNALNDSLEIILNSLASDKDFKLTSLSKDNLKTLIDDLSSVKGCDSVFMNRPFMEHTLVKDSSAHIKSVFQNFKENCISNSKRLSDEKEQELLKIALRLFEGIKKNSLIDKDDASEAGAIIVFDTIPFCFRKEAKEADFYLKKINKGFEKSYTAKGKGVQKELSVFDKHLPKKEKPKKTDPDPSTSLLPRSSDLDTCPDIPFILDSIQFEFENDNLQNIKAIGKINGKLEIFKNVYPISFSTKADGNTNYFLYSISSDPVKRISTNDLFLYNYNLLLYTENYAPKDQVIYVKPNENGVILFKEKNSEILKTKVFTDLVGLDDSEPNGIIQLEFSKSMSLFTRPIPLSKLLPFKNKKNYSKNYFIFLNSIEPVFTLSKIEGDDDRLPLIKIDSIAYASYNDMLRYRKSSLGLDLSVLKIGFPSIHSTVEIGADLNFSLVDFSSFDTSLVTTQIITNPDSTQQILQTEQITENTSTNLTRDIGLSLQWNILPSDKYELSIRYSLKWFKFYPKDELNPIVPFTDRLAISKITTSTEQKEKNTTEIYHIFQLLGTARLSKRGELFFRGRYHFVDKNTNQNFFQIQLGYSYFFFSTN